MNPNDKPPPRDYRAEVTYDIINMLEEGTAPWQKPWASGQAGAMPFNPTTGKPYRGGNVLALTIAAMRKGFEDPRWMTYRQAAEKGWQVRKGEKASQIEFWEAKSVRKDEGTDEDEKRSRLIHRVYSVFNAQQIDGIPPVHIESRKPFEIIEAGERYWPTREPRSATVEIALFIRAPGIISSFRTRNSSTMHPAITQPAATS
jgi:antirestriction protein ArdC